MALPLSPPHKAFNGTIWRHHSTILFVATLAVLMVACGGGTEEQGVQPDPASAQSEPLGSTATTPITNNNSATLAWDPVAADNLSGYRVYFGTMTRSYAQLPGEGLPVGNVTTYTVSGLSSGMRYYFAVTAVDTLGNESGFSQEVFKDIL